MRPRLTDAELTNIYAATCQTSSLSFCLRYIVIYRGNDFVPTSVAPVLAERQELTKQVQKVEEKVRHGAFDVIPSDEDEATAPAGTLTEF
ncbi:hypothetical protein RIF29_22444 [Crotalaria pallida]|uniref:Uncharacterized protein n=1 Tax=Crotalaria pallida TaxID=3830 RepID=A0AAN9IAD2_CROPI